MKKTRVWVRILCLALAALMILGVVVSAVMGAYAEEDRDQYRLDMYYHQDSQAFEVSQVLTYRNRTGQSLSCVRFHLYENAFRRNATAPFVSDELTDAYPEGFAPGGVDFVSVTVDGEKADWGVYGPGETYLRVDAQMEPGEEREFRFDFYVLLPTSRGRCGAGGLDVRLCQFYPVAAVWDDDLHDFALQPASPLGKSLYSGAADYRVTVDVPASCIVAATGELTAEETLPGYRKRVTFEAEAREFALAMSRRYSVISAGDATVYTANAPGASDALNALDSAMAWFARWLGPCPAVRLAESDILDDGISFPGLILIRSGLLASGGRELEWEIVRQAAQQYFSCLVGPDPAHNPFLCDSLSEYAALLYFEDAHGHQDYLDRLNERCLPALQITLPGALTVDGSVYLFDSRQDYDAVIRERGCAVLHEMRSLMGREELMDGIRLYVERFSGKNAALSDFVAALDDATGKRWDELLVGQMRTIGEYARQDMTRYE